MGIELYNLNFRRFIPGFSFQSLSLNLFSFLLIFLFTSHPLYSGTNDWELKKEKDGVKVFVRSVAGSTINEVRATFYLKASLNSIMALLKDVPGFKDWIYRCKEVALLSQPNQHEVYYYQQTMVPWPISNRDLIVHSHWNQDEKSKVISINGKAIADYIAEKDGVVRIKKFSNSWKITPMTNGMVQLDYQVSVDPAGAIPDWMINLSSTEGPYQTCINITKAINNPKYKATKAIVLEP